MKQNNKKIFVLLITVFFVCSLIPLSQIQFVKGEMFYTNSHSYIGEGDYAFYPNIQNNTYLVFFQYDYENTIFGNAQLRWRIEGTAYSFIVLFSSNGDVTNAKFGWGAQPSYTEFDGGQFCSFLTNAMDSTSFAIFVDGQLNLVSFYFYTNGVGWNNLGYFDIPEVMLPIPENDIPATFIYNNYNGDHASITLSLYDTLSESPVDEDYFHVSFNLPENGIIKIDILDESDEYVIRNSQINSTFYDFYIPSSFILKIYGVPDDGYYFANATMSNNIFHYSDMTVTYLSGDYFEVTDDDTITVNFDVLPYGAPQNVDLVVDNPKGNVITININGEITSLTSEYYGWSRFSVPQNTYITLEYVDIGDNYEFIQWNIIFVFQTFSGNGSMPQEFDVNPVTLNTSVDFGEEWRWITAITVNIQELWTGEGSEPTLPPLTPTAEPSTTYNPSVTPPAYGVVHTILEFLFGDSGLLGTGFGILIIFIIMLPCIIFEQLRNIYGFVLFFNLGAVLVIATSLIGLWLLIIVVLVDVMIIVMKSGILNNINGVS